LVRAVHHLAAFEIDLDEARRRHLVERHAVRIDQEVVIAVGHARRQVREDQIVPAEVRDQPVTSREIDAQAPLRFTDLRFDVHAAMLHQASPVGLTPAGSTMRTTVRTFARVRWTTPCGTTMPWRGASSNEPLPSMSRSRRPSST